jgi:MbtH protein
LTSCRAQLGQVQSACDPDHLGDRAMSWGDENTVFTVVKNHEEQYSIWPTYKPIPDGWVPVGMQGTKQDCLAYIDKEWTDMRPLSLRKALAAQHHPAADSAS